MARYRLWLPDLAPALRALGLQVPELDGEAYTHVEIELEPVEEPAPASGFVQRRAEPYREVVTELVRAGYSNRAIAEELNGRLMLGPQGGQWHSSSIKRLRARLGV